MEDGVGRSLWVGKRTPTLKWQNCSSSNGHFRLAPKASHLQLLNEQHTQKTIYGLFTADEVRMTFYNPPFWIWSSENF